MKRVVELPRVSVVMAVRDGAQYLGDSLQSMLCQTFADFELIIVDDGSADDTPWMLQQAAACDQRIRVITQEKRGMARSLNRGILASRGS